jgi:hypothetical protein
MGYASVMTTGWSGTNRTLTARLVRWRSGLSMSADGAYDDSWSGSVDSHRFSNGEAERVGRARTPRGADSATATTEKGEYEGHTDVVTPPTLSNSEHLLSLVVTGDRLNGERRSPTRLWRLVSITSLIIFTSIAQQNLTYATRYRRP